MSTIAFSDLASHAPTATLVIESLEGGKYLPRVKTDDHIRPIANGQSGLLTFNSLREALDSLGHYPWQETRLLQHTAYDEMIGNPSGSPTPFEITIP